MALSLSSIVPTKRVRPPVMTIYGSHGIGKTTFGASAPNPIFIPTEDGQSNVKADAFPLATKFGQVMEAISVLKEEKHDYKTVVLDSLDWTERLIQEEIAEREGVPSIDKVPYGAGYGDAASKVRELVLAFQSLRDARNMAVIMLAHMDYIRVEDPTKPVYMRAGIKLHKRAAPIVTEASEMIGYAALDSAIKEEDLGFNKKRERVMVNAPRVLYFQKSDAFDSKNRFGLPNKIPFTWADFISELKKAQTEEEKADG